MTIGLKTLATLALAVLAGCATIPERAMIMAAEVGVRAPDSINGQPGNPFATAFIGLLDSGRVTIGDLGTRLREETFRLSGGLLRPEVGVSSKADSVRLADDRASGHRVALVLIHSNYSDGLPRLDGAAHDAGRVGAALRRAGYATEVLVDPGRGERATALRRLEQASAQADVAILYVTGHGIMSAGEAYLLDSDFSLGWRDEALPAHAIAISSLGAGMRADQANLVLFGGCRSYEWW